MNAKELLNLYNLEFEDYLEDVNLSGSMYLEIEKTIK